MKERLTSLATMLDGTCMSILNDLTFAFGEAHFFQNGADGVSSRLFDKS